MGWKYICRLARALPCGKFFNRPEYGDKILKKGVRFALAWSVRWQFGVGGRRDT